MDLSKKACLSNMPRTNTLVLDSKQKTTGVTGEYDAFPTFFFGVGNRSVGTALPAQHIQSSGMPFAVHPSLTFEERQVADQPTDHSSKILYDQKKVGILGNKFENPVSTESTGGLDASLTVSAKPSQSSTKVKCRRKGSHFSEYAIASLEQICIYGMPSREAMECVAKDTGLSYKQVRAWCYHKKTKEQKRLAKLENTEVNELPLKKREGPFDESTEDSAFTPVAHLIFSNL
jgi:hypothetical protein